MRLKHKLVLMFCVLVYYVNDIYSTRVSAVLSNWSERVRSVVSPPSLSDNTKKWIACGVICIFIIMLPTTTTTATATANTTAVRKKSNHKHADLSSGVPSDYMNMWDALLSRAEQDVHAN